MIAFIKKKATELIQSIEFLEKAQGLWSQNAQQGHIAESLGIISAK